MWAVDGILDWMDGALKQQTHNLIGDDLKRFMEGSNNFSRSDFFELGNLEAKNKFTKMFFKASAIVLPNRQVPSFSSTSFFGGQEYKRQAVWLVRWFARC